MFNHFTTGLWAVPADLPTRSSQISDLIFQATEQIGVIAALRRHSAWSAAWSTVCGWTALAWMHRLLKQPQKFILKDHIQIETLQNTCTMGKCSVIYFKLQGK